MPTTSSRNLLKSLGLVLLLTGAIAAKGEGMVVILLGGLAIVLLGLAEFRTISQENSLMIRLILSSTLALVTVIKLIESVGKSFTPGHLPQRWSAAVSGEVAHQYRPVRWFNCSPALGVVYMKASSAN